MTRPLFLQELHNLMNLVGAQNVCPHSSKFKHFLNIRSPWIGGLFKAAPFFAIRSPLGIISPVISGTPDIQFR